MPVLFGTLRKWPIRDFFRGLSAGCPVQRSGLPTKQVKDNHRNISVLVPLKGYAEPWQGRGTENRVRLKSGCSLRSSF